MPAFQRYELRTTDVLAARDFYRAVFGPGFWAGPLSAVDLPAPARARGAPPHWLGYVGPVDLARASSTLTDLGSQPLGPPGTAVFRDPGGALVGLSAEPADPGGRDPVAWHFHASRDAETSFTPYAGAFGWLAGDLLVVDDPALPHRLFQTAPGAKPAGSFASLARLPHVHSQWLFYFPVADLDGTLARVGLGGGIALDPVRAPNGARLAACDDRQGAAFGLLEPAS